MEEHIVKIRSVRNVTHDVLRFTIDKPAGYGFVPGQATEVAINKDEWKEERRPFTFTCLPGDSHLEFTIKTYPSRNGVTNALRQLKSGDELLLHDVWGAISYKGEGVFIAGGAGVTPFISIFRFLRSKNLVAGNKLLFANKKRIDIILKQEFENMLGKNFINILSDEKADGFEHGHITEEFLKKYIPDLNTNIYLCGPEPMMDAVEKQLSNLGVKEGSIVKEAFKNY